MTMVVFEGPDGGGKSTLIQTLTREHLFRHPWIVSSEGPEKWPGEINDRIARYFQTYSKDELTLYDRHPCVSQLAYTRVHNQSPPDPILIEQFYQAVSYIIYCRPVGAFTHTAVGEWDTPEYLEKVDNNYAALLSYYDQWALRSANFIYRIGDPIEPIAHMIERII